MMFALKKFISAFLMPFPIFLLLLGIGFLFWQRRHYKKAKILILLAVLWITLLSYPPFSALLLAPLENSYTKIRFAQEVPHYIHVLGSGHCTNENIPLSSELDSASLTRMSEGVSIYKAHPGMKIIFSGYGNVDPISNARKNSQMAMALGVDPKDIILLESAKDTHDEAQQAKQIVGDQPLILVTSAFHIRRATALFNKAGITVVAAPTDFHVKKRDTLWQLPSSGGLARSELVFHEYLGILWGKLTGLM